MANQSESAPDLRAVPRRSLGVVAAALLIAGCAAPSQQIEAPSDPAGVTSMARIAPTASEAATPSATPTAAPATSPTSSPVTSSGVSFGVLPGQQPPDYVSQITCSGPIGTSDPVAIVRLRAAVEDIGDVVLRDYADPGSPRTACSFPASTWTAQLIDAHHVVIEADSRTNTYAVIDLPEVRFHWFQLPSSGPGPWQPVFVAVSPGLDQVLWVSLDSQDSGTDIVHVTTSAGDTVVATVPDNNLGRCGSPDDSSWGGYTHSGAHAFVLDQPFPSTHSLLVLEAETVVLSVLPPSAGWSTGAFPAMALWSPTSETLFYRQGDDVWTWTPGSDPVLYLQGVHWFYPTITPDGAHLAYAVLRPDDLHSVYLVDLAHGGSPQLIGDEPRTLPVFVNNTQLWFRSESENSGCAGSNGERPLIYNLTDSSEAPSIIDEVIAAWPAVR